MLISLFGFGTIPVNISSRLDIGSFFRITNISAVIGNVLTLVLIFGTMAFVLYFLLSAFEWLTAGGDKAKVESARNRITNAFTGIVLLALSWAVYLIVIYVIGLPINPISSGGSNPGTCPGFCLCSDGDYAPDGFIAPASIGGQCATCNAGSWGPPYYPAGDPSCPYSVNCNPCPF